MNRVVNRKGLLLLCAATLLTTGCGGKTPMPEPVTPSLSVSPATLSLSDAAAPETITVTANCDWGVSAADKD